MAFTYRCPYDGTHCDRGDKKPQREKCRNCGSRLSVRAGKWAVFVWNGQGRYFARDALASFEVQSAASRKAQALGGSTHCVRFVDAS